MKTINITQFKNKVSYYISLVEKGEEVEVCKRNVPIARVLPIKNGDGKNRTVLGCGKGTVTFLSEDLSEPFIPSEDWEMFA
jgi:prevent-host-death family protein